MRIQLTEYVFDYLEKSEPEYEMVERGLRNVLVRIDLLTYSYLTYL